MTLTTHDRRTLEAAASALRHMPAKARAGHLARRLSEMAARMKAGERDDTWQDLRSERGN